MKVWSRNRTHIIIINYNRTASLQLSHGTRLESCWEKDLDWNLIPQKLKEVRRCTVDMHLVKFKCHWSIVLQGCEQIGCAMNMPVSAVLAGLLLIVRFAVSYSERGQTGWSRFYYGYRFVCLLGQINLLSANLFRNLLWSRRAMQGSWGWFYLLDDGLSILRKNGRHKDTSLTVGEFAQPVVARTLIELQANFEKGLCQRFLWVVPKPVAIPLDELQQVDREFSTAIGKKAPLCVLVDASLYLMLRHDYNHTSFMCNASTQLVWCHPCGNQIIQSCFSHGQLRHSGTKACKYTAADHNSLVYGSTLWWVKQLTL